jgi:hypothetical protein
VTEWAQTAAVLSAFHDVMAGPLRSLRSALPAAIHPDGPTLDAFEGFTGAGGAGLSAFVVARHPDGRSLHWQVELWVDRHSVDREWRASVKGEIDLEDDEGLDRCVLNEQRSVASGAQAAVAVRELGESVGRFPLGELLSMRWEPEAP